MEVSPVPECCVSIIDELIKQQKLKGMTQQDLAHLTQSVIARMESKKVIPQLDTLLKVVSALGCHLEIVPRKAV